MKYILALLWLAWAGMSYYLAKAGHGFDGLVSFLLGYFICWTSTRKQTTEVADE